MADDAQVPAADLAQQLAARDREVEQLGSLLRKANDRARTAEQALDAASRELAQVRAALAQELATSSDLVEMAGEAERRAMKAEQTAEALRSRLTGVRPSGDVAYVPPQQQSPSPQQASSARQALEGLVQELHATDVRPVLVQPEVVELPVDDVAPAPRAAEPDSAPEPAPEPAVRASVTVLPTGSARKRWSR